MRRIEAEVEPNPNLNVQNEFGLNSMDDIRTDIQNDAIVDSNVNEQPDGVEIEVHMGKILFCFE